MTMFDLVSSRVHAALQRALDADPRAAPARNADGASLPAVRLEQQAGAK